VVCSRTATLALMRSDDMSAFARAREFGEEVVDELKKVTWPDWPQLRNATFVVLVFVLVVAAIIWIMDFGVRSLIDLILNLFAG
jgi:preprotein translocase subunit SecE